MVQLAHARRLQGAGEEGQAGEPPVRKMSVRSLPPIGSVTLDQQLRIVPRRSLGLWHSLGLFPIALADRSDHSPPDPSHRALSLFPHLLSVQASGPHESIAARLVFVSAFCRSGRKKKTSPSLFFSDFFLAFAVVTAPFGRGGALLLVVVIAHVSVPISATSGGSVLKSPRRANMKVPPFSLFPLCPLDTYEYDLPTKALVYPETHGFLSTPPPANKGSLAFILDEMPCSGSETESDDQASTAPLPNPLCVQPARRRVTPLKASSPDSKKGSKYCIIEGCTSRAKHARKCWRHGGSVKCKVPDCINRAKSKGVCWSHGGGTICSHSDCETIAVSHGFCWAHGGGKRCQIDGCSRPAYERTDNYCATHHKQRLRVRHQ